MQLNRLCLFDGSVDVDYFISKNLELKQSQSSNKCITIGFKRYDTGLIEGIFNSTTGVLEVELKQYFYLLSDEELKETSAVLLKIINECSGVMPDNFVTNKQFANRMKDLCVIRAFLNATQSKLAKDYMLSNYSAEH